MAGFILKKLVSRLFFPVPVCTGLLAAGVVLLLTRRWRRLGLGFTVGGTVLLLAVGYGVPGRSALRRLEWRYPPLAPGATLADLPGAGAASRVWVAVLGGGISEDPGLPANSRLDVRLQARVVEGARLLRGTPQANLILSLPGSLDAEQKQALARDLCAVLAVDPERVRLITGALDTEDEARAVAAIAGNEPLALVTSASHMPRAMELFEGAGLHPTACPTDYLTSRPGLPVRLQPSSLYPCARNVLETECAVYEYLGLAWARLRGKTGPRTTP